MMAEEILPPPKPWMGKEWLNEEFKRTKILLAAEQDFQAHYNKMYEAAMHYFLEWAEWLEVNRPEIGYIEPITDDSGEGHYRYLEVHEIAEYIYRKVRLETNPGDPQVGWGYLVDKKLVFDALPKKYKVDSQ